MMLRSFLCCEILPDFMISLREIIIRRNDPVSDTIYQRQAGDMEKTFMRAGTHSGKFHADEVMATAILREIFDLEVVRSRDPDELKDLDIIYDIGEGEFDHHQMDKRYRDNGIPYAAYGLIWERFGRDVIRMQDDGLSEENLEYLFHELDDMLIQGIDAADNGVRTTKTIIPTLNITAIISKFNPTWDSGLDEESSFNEAVDLASSVFKNVLRQKLSVVYAEEHVRSAYLKRTVPELLILDKPYPWNELLNQIDEEKQIVYVISPDHGQYIIQTVRRSDGGYGDVKPLPQSWAGKRDAELCAVTGTEDAVFCHADRFIAGARSLESIMKMAELALAEPEEQKHEEMETGILKAIKRFLLSRRIRVMR
jgi:uncharacterized UPF0160 family protein